MVSVCMVLSFTVLSIYADNDDNMWKFQRMLDINIRPMCMNCVYAVNEMNECVTDILYRNVVYLVGVGMQTS